MTTTLSKDDVYWQTHIDNYLSSSLSVKTYCKQHNLVPHHFRYRYYRHRQNKQTLSSTSPTIKSEFVPITVNVTQPTTFKITLPNGIHCAVSTPIDTTALKQLLGVLIS